MDKANVEQRRQCLLETQADCLHRMSPNARELFWRKVGVRNGSCTPFVGSGAAVEPAENVRMRRLNEARNRLDHIYRRAMSCGDLANAVRAVQESIRIEQPERRGRNDAQQEMLGMEGVFPSALPGTPGGPPITEEGRKELEEIEKLSPADRMLLREGYNAVMRFSELEARAKKATMADLLRHPAKGIVENPSSVPADKIGR